MTAYGQKNLIWVLDTTEKGDYFYLQSSNSKSDSIIVKGVALIKETLNSVPNLQPVVVYWNTKAAKKQFVLNTEGVYNRDTGYFEFKLPVGEYIFQCNQLGYDFVVTKRLKLNHDITFIFLL